MMMLARFLGMCLVLCAALTLPLSLGGCAASRPTQPSISTDDAALLREQARGLLRHDPARAKVLLERAVAINPYDGQTHNNLGVALLTLDHLGEAAAAFDRARLLLPGHPDPRTNLGLAFERAGRLDDAAGAYRAALEVSPSDLPASQALASLLSRSGLAEARRGELDELLQRIAMHAGDEGWRRWARERLLQSPHGFHQPTSQPNGLHQQLAPARTVRHASWRGVMRRAVSRCAPVRA